MNIWQDASTSPRWSALSGASRALASVSLRTLFERDSRRAEAMTLGAVGITLDYSRQRLDREALDLLVGLADDVALRQRIEAMFSGAMANPTEKRAVLHTALRRESSSPLRVDGQDVMPMVQQERSRMLRFAEGVRSGEIRPSEADRFELVVNIGIGGSDLGPAMATQALARFAARSPRVVHVSNIDGCRLADILAEADARTTLFVICSKTFTTLETLTNARAARKWVSNSLGEHAVRNHFAAVSVNQQAMDAFGVHPDYRFALWDWVGGRYSLWSSVGVSAAIAIGARHFEDFLRGGREMDEHFATAPWSANLPVLMALLGVWNVDFLRLPTLAVLPYDDRLARFPAYLQQLEMESNGKSTRMDGSAPVAATCPVVWGEPGNNAQHSFFQLLHQGTPAAALDFIAPAVSSCGDQQAQDLALANCLAQAEAFAFGQLAHEIDADPALLPHRVHQGDRPSSLLLFRELEPATLGRLVALYEHKVFTQSVIWGINAFDQWGVELGKKLATGIVPFVRGEAEPQSQSLRNVVGVLHRLRSS